MALGEIYRGLRFRGSSLCSLIEVRGSAMDDGGKF